MAQIKSESSQTVEIPSRRSETISSTRLSESPVEIDTPRSSIPEKEPLIRPDDHLASGSGDEEDERNDDADDEATTRDLRFDPPSPSPFKRMALVAFTLLLFYFALSLRKILWAGNKKPEIIYASRYSKEHKYRPAASPIITHTLKDGRLRIHGAAPTATPEPSPTPMTRKTRPKSGAKRPRTRAKAKKPAKKAASGRR